MQRLVGRARGELVGLVQQAVHRGLARAQQLDHLPVELGQAAPDVRHQDEPPQRLAFEEIAAQLRLPVIALRVRDLRIAVARQVDQIAPVGDAETVQRLGAAGGLADAGEPGVA